MAHPYISCRDTSHSRKQDSSGHVVLVLGNACVLFESDTQNVWDREWVNRKQWAMYSASYILDLHTSWFGARFGRSGRGKYTCGYVQMGRVGQCSKEKQVWNTTAKTNIAKVENA